MPGDSELAEHSQVAYRMSVVMSKNRERTLTAMNTTNGTPTGGYGSPRDDLSSTRSRKKRLFRWGAGVTLAGFLAGGGIALAAVSGGSSAGTAAASSAASAANLQAAELNSALSTAAGSTSTPPARVRWALGRLRRLGGVDGTIDVPQQDRFPHALVRAGHHPVGERQRRRDQGGGRHHLELADRERHRGQEEWRQDHDERAVSRRNSVRRGPGGQRGQGRPPDRYQGGGVFRVFAVSGTFWI